MKQKLLFILSVLLITVTSNAQIKVWNFATNTLAGYDNLLNSNTKVEAVLFPNSGQVVVSGAAATTNLISTFGDAVAGKVYYKGGSDRFRLSNSAITSYNTETKDLFSNFWTDTEWGRMYSNGNGSTTNRHYGFNLTIGDVITLYYYVDTTNATNTINVETPSTPGAPTTFNVDNSSSLVGQMYKITATETGLYKFYCTDGKLCMGRIYEGDVTLTLGVNANKSPVSTNVEAVSNRVYVSNVKSNTEINIYSITGALVKSFKTNNDMDFNFKSGLYIATVKTVEGQKTVKLLMK